MKDLRGRHRGPDGRGRRLGRRRVTVEEGHRRALLGEEPAGGLSDAPAAARDERNAAGHAARHQTRVSWVPAFTTIRAMAPSTQLSPGARTTEVDRTRKERGLAPGAGVP